MILNKITRPLLSHPNRRFRKNKLQLLLQVTMNITSYSIPALLHSAEQNFYTKYLQVLCLNKGKWTKNFRLISKGTILLGKKKRVVNFHYSRCTKTSIIWHFLIDGCEMRVQKNSSGKALLPLQSPSPITIVWVQIFNPLSPHTKKPYVIYHKKREWTTYTSNNMPLSSGKKAVDLCVSPQFIYTHIL